ncbi:hypothetical protein CSKR_112486 [Clonorchis sinensis]|uniref:Uncharacterized protein n=1 Tax=Clonorchis sinensis TaxID=79923 RepID=A0A3R7GSC8_CLOSI|nr:hypothetical protein CSKR_112486 [Clonorchis sinensis]
MHCHFYGTSRHMSQPPTWRARRLFVRPPAIDQPGTRDSVSVAGTPLSISQWVAEQQSEWWDRASCKTEVKLIGLPKNILAKM